MIDNNLTETLRALTACNVELLHTQLRQTQLAIILSTLHTRVL